MFYVYVYKDPTSKEIFYVGKGSKRRYKKHLYETWNNTTNKLRLAKITSIRNKGQEPIVEFVEQNLQEEEALILESFLINQHGKIIDNTGSLTNIADGGKQPPRGVGNAQWAVNNPSAKMKGKTYEEIYGPEKARMIKAQRSKALKNRTFSDNTILKMKQSAKERKDGRKYLMKKVCTPDGIFHSVTECANFYNMSLPGINWRIKSRHDWNYS